MAAASGSHTLSCWFRIRQSDDFFSRSSSPSTWPGASFNSAALDSGSVNSGDRVVGKYLYIFPSPDLPSAPCEGVLGSQRTGP